MSFSAGNGSLSVGIGVKKTDDRTEQSAATNAVSVLKAGRDLTIDAGRDANLQATDATAGRDLAVVAERDVNLLSAADQTDYARLHSEMFAGVTLSVSSKLIGAGEKLVDAAGKLGGDNGAYAAAPAALAIYQGYKAVTPTKPADGVGQATGGLDLSKINGLTDWQGMQASGLGSVSLSVGASSQKSKTTVSSSTPVVTSLVSGGSTAISAEEGSITGTGAQIAAGFNANGQPVATADASAGNILLSAAKDISLTSAQSTSRTDSSSTSKSASVGIDLATMSVSANAAYGKSKKAATSSNELDSHVTGTGTVALNSGNDTSLKGAVVTGETVIANVGGDLTIESRQDTSRYNEKSTSISGGISASGVTVGASRSTVKGDFANVAEQSGIVAGAGGYHVAVGGGVDLKAGVIASSAEKDNNALSADHLTYSNLDNVSKASSSGYGLSVGIGFDGKVGAPTPSVSQPAKEEESGRALATLTPGTLTLDNQQQDLSGLNTDLGKANTTVTPYDIDRLKARQESAAALSELLNGLAGDISNKLHFAEGGPEKAALHAAVGAIVAKVAGGDIAAGAVAGAASEIANGVLQEVLKANPNLSDPDRKAITQWVAVVVGAVAGGETGAATAIDNVNHNFLTHQQAYELAQKLEKCQSDGDPAACKTRVSQEYVDLDFEQEHELDACRTTKCVTDLLGDLNGDPQFAYTKVLRLQELGVSEELAQRLLAYQVRERWLTGDSSVFEQRIMDVVAGASYCEANGGSDGCFLKGQALKYSSDAVMTAAYAILGLSTVTPGKGGKAEGQGSVSKGEGEVTAGQGGLRGAEDAGSASNVALFERQRASYAAQEIKNAQPVGSALKDDPLHRAPSYVIDQIPEKGRVFTVRGGDGSSYNLTQMEGAVNGNSGVFEWMVNSRGELTHQRFIPGGKITGTPNQIPSRLP